MDETQSKLVEDRIVKDQWDERADQTTHIKSLRNIANFVYKQDAMKMFWNNLLKKSDIGLNLSINTPENVELFF